MSYVPKFYLFDVGVAGALTNRQVQEEKGQSFGRAFEHFVFMELAAHRSLKELDYAINYWRTKTGLEVDFVLGGGQIAIEVKSTSRVDNRDLIGLKAFREEYKPRQTIIVCNEKAARIVDSISIKPWREFLAELWAGKIIS